MGTSRITLFLLLALTQTKHATCIKELCFDKISDTEAIYLQEHPGGGKAAVATQKGVIYLTTLPGVGKKGSMTQLGTFLDVSDRVHVDNEMGFHSFAFHPEFSRNGRFFVTYTCDSRKTPDCVAQFGCRPRRACTPKEDGDPRGPYTTIIAEYSAGKNPLEAEKLEPNEVRRVLAIARPHDNHHGGHLFFGKDAMMYFTSGDGGSQNDPWKLAQNPRSLFGKVLRFDVNGRTTTTNYSIPRTNPFRGKHQNNLIYALGFRNPWRCDQDPITGTMACGDVGGSRVEEVNVVVPRGNYQWVNYEGDNYQTGEQNRKTFLGISLGPHFSYTHDDLGGLGCIIGGVFYTNPANACLMGKYLYADHSGPMWVASIQGQKTERVSFKCAPGSPMQCPEGGDGSNTEWGEVYSWSKDRLGNAYFLTSEGIFRVAKQSTCDITC